MKACSMDYWLDITDDLPLMLAVDFGWESVAVVYVHGPILASSNS